MGFITVNEAVEVSDFNASLVRKYCNEGRFKAEKRGPRMWLINERSFASFVARNGPPVRGNPRFIKVKEDRNKKILTLMGMLPPGMQRRIVAGEIRVTISNLQELVREENTSARNRLFDVMASRAWPGKTLKDGSLRRWRIDIEK